jgi:hypothetical protein
MYTYIYTYMHVYYQSHRKRGVGRRRAKHAHAWWNIPYIIPGAIGTEKPAGDVTGPVSGMPRETGAQSTLYSFAISSR